MTAAPSILRVGWRSGVGGEGRNDRSLDSSTGTGGTVKLSLIVNRGGNLHHRRGRSSKKSDDARRCPGSGRAAKLLAPLPP